MDSGLGLFECRDSGFWWKRRARFGIVILNGTREFAILPSGISRKWQRKSSCNIRECGK